MPYWISCTTSSYGSTGLRGALDHLPTVGVYSIELAITTADEGAGNDPLAVSTASSESELRRVERALADAGVQVASCRVSAGNALEPDVVQLVRRKLEIAHRFGAKLVVGDAGWAGSDNERDLLDRHLREIGDHAAGLGLVYCCDVGPGLCRDHRWMLHAMQELDHPQLRLNFDPGKLLYYNDYPSIEVALAKTCHLVRHVNLCDWNGAAGAPRYPALGYGGCVDFLRTLQLLRDSGYRGPYTISIDDRPDTVDACRQRVVDSLRTLRECGYLDG